MTDEYDPYNGHCGACYSFKGEYSGECVEPLCECHIDTDPLIRLTVDGQSVLTMVASDLFTMATDEWADLLSDEEIRFTPKPNSVIRLEIKRNNT